MTDAQIIAIAITVLAVLGGTIVNNSRIGDLNNRFADINTRFADTNRRIDDAKELIRAEMRANFSAVETKLDSMLKLLADLDQRVTKLER